MQVSCIILFFSTSFAPLQYSPKWFSSVGFSISLFMALSRKLQFCVQEACLRDFICITSTAICQPDTGGGWGSYHNDHFNPSVVYGTPVKIMVVLAVNKAWRCSPGHVFYGTVKFLLFCTRGVWDSHRNITFTNNFRQFNFFPFCVMGRHYSRHWVHE